jgi:hypothetical protein
MLVIVVLIKLFAYPYMNNVEKSIDNTTYSL